MKNANQIVFRRLTTADFFNINKPKGMEVRGGGQSYIDFPTTAVKPENWESFFAGIKKLTTQSGPLWKFTVSSIGLNKSQTAEIGQRRPASYNIRAQKLGTKDSSRLYAWHPQYSGFPAPKDPTKRAGIPNLVIYLIRTTNGDYWAGWFQRAAPKASWATNPSLMEMFTKKNGYINLSPGVAFDENNADWPFLKDVAASPVQDVPVSAGSFPTVPGKPIELKPSGGKAEAKQISPPSPTVKKPLYKAKSEVQLINRLFNDDIADDGNRDEEAGDHIYCRA